MVIAIKRDDSRPPHRQPLTWKPLWMPESSGRLPSATIVCPNGHWASIEDHEIDPSGRVTPSLICPECGWHGTEVRLEGWPPGS